LASRGAHAASRFILVVWAALDTLNRITPKPHAALQWHVSRSVSQRTKGIDLAELIGYNLSNWTGLEERLAPQG
jgi:hypothetical protein